MSDIMVISVIHDTVFGTKIIVFQEKWEFRWRDQQFEFLIHQKRYSCKRQLNFTKIGALQESCVITLRESQPGAKNLPQIERQDPI